MEYLISKGEVQLNNMKEETNDKKLKKYKGMLIDAIWELEEIFEISEDDGTPITNKKQLEKKNIDELIEIEEQLLEKLKEIV